MAAMAGGGASEHCEITESLAEKMERDRAPYSTNPGADTILKLIKRSGSNRAGCDLPGLSSFER